MPLLNGKKIPSAAPIPYDPKRRRKEVFYLKLTNELFSGYEAYIKRYNLYYQPLWECEITGKKKLTYAQALESEKSEKNRAEYLFCKALRKHILLKIQLKTTRLDELVKEVYHCDYIPDEVVQCTLDGFRQNAIILQVLPDSESSDSKQYRIQLIDTLDGDDDDDGIRIVKEGQMRRNKKVFNRNNIQRFITECAKKDRDTPWIIHDHLAIAYNIDNSLPDNLKDDMFLSPKARKRKLKAAERDAEKRIKRELNLLQKQQMKLEKERIREEKKLQAAIKYPLEDLDLPVYRKKPDENWSIVDMCPKSLNGDTVTIPYPSGGKPTRPIAHQDSPIPPELYDLFLSTWSFLTVFAEPLKIATYSIDDFETALFHNTHQPKATVLVEYNASLLNVIIKERKEDIASELANGDVMEDYLEAEQEKEKEKLEAIADEEEEEEVVEIDNHRPERIWRDKEQLRVSQKWDTKELRANYDRRGWENVLIGCLNDVATPDLIPDLDKVLRHLVPRTNSTSVEREKQYPTLTIKQKLDLLGFLVDVVNESNLIKNYMDYCQDQLTELKRQRAEYKKEGKALYAKHVELGKRKRAARLEKINPNMEENEGEGLDEEKEQEEKELDEENEQEEKEDEDEDGEQDDTLSDNGEDSDDEIDIDSESSDEQYGKNQNKQPKSKKKQSEEVEEDLQSLTNEREKLDEQERTLRKKEEHLERTMRRFMTLRIRPLGKDRFYNRYIYLDNIGLSNTSGSGRLYVHSPCDTDIRAMMERDEDTTDYPEQPWGYGGGRWFIRTLMRDQGLIKESEWLEKRMDELASDPNSEYKGWWMYYSDPDEIQQLIAWLNPKGIRESKLKNELIKQQPNIVSSIKKRTESFHQFGTVEKRITRAKASKNIPDYW